MGVEESLAAILGSDGTPVGGGVLVEPELVLTCAHVVDRALSRTNGEARPSSTVSLTLFGARDKPLTAMVDPREDAWSPYSKGDLCLLKLKDPSTNASAKPASLAQFDARYHSFTAVGFPSVWKGEFGIATGRIVGYDDGSRLYVLRPDVATQISAQAIKPGVFSDQKPVATQISEGFSGGPVEVDGQIVGIVSQARPPKEATGYMIPAAAFPKSLRAVVRSFDNAIIKEFPHVPILRNAIEQRRRKMIAGVHPFDIRLRLCDSFADALKAQSVPGGDGSAGDTSRGYKSRDLHPADFARCLQIGKDADGNGLSRVLVHAPGGAGKSNFLMELMWVAPDTNLVPFLLDFSKKPQAPKEDIVNAEDQFKDWFSGRGTGAVDKLFELATKGSGAEKPLLVVDGFNQAPLNWQNALKRIEDISGQDLAGAAIVIADRMVDHNPDSQFRRAVILPLAPVVYAEALSDKPGQAVIADSNWYPILSSPLFLNKFLQMSGSAKVAGASVVPSRFSILDQYFRDEEACGFKPVEMRALAEFAYEAYRQFNGTAFPYNRLDELLYHNPAARLTPKQTSSLESKIKKEGLIQDLGKGQRQFQHQILHDQLAALKVASASEEDEETLLRAPAFDILSIKGASSDAIELAVEALQYPDRLLASKRREALTLWNFLTEVYDWNYRITFQCVASLDRRGDSPLRPWMRHAIYTLNLERAFDPFLYTAIRTRQLRDQIPQSLDVTYLGAGSGEELREKVKQALSDETQKNLEGVSEAEKKQFEDWSELYFRDRPFSPGDLDPLWRDPLLSWTAAKVLRRGQPDKAVTAELARLYQISKATSDSAARAAGFRWRITHALGRSTPSAKELLMDVAFDRLENDHVRYGAIRSLVELTVANAPDTDQTQVFEALRARLKEFFPVKPTRAAASIRQQLRRVCALNEPYVSGRVDWLRDWIGTGLSKYERVLREGQTLAASSGGLDDEAALWGRWADTVRQAANAPDWPARRSLWEAMIERDS